jgi:hypothetical protein
VTIVRFVILKIKINFKDFPNFREYTRYNYHCSVSVLSKTVLKRTVLTESSKHDVSLETKIPRA